MDKMESPYQGQDRSFGQWTSHIPFHSQQQQQQPPAYTAPPPVQTPYQQQFPFSHLCPPGSNLITLQICDKGPHCDYLLAPGATPFQPTYSVHFSKKIKQITINYHLQQSTNSGREAVVLNLPQEASSNPVEMKFGWSTWGCSFVPTGPAWGDEWLSDVGTLEGHSLVWRDLGRWKESGYVLRCFDTDDRMADVCTVLISHASSGQIEIPVHLIRDQNGLDEMVGVAYTALTQRRATDQEWVPEGSDSSSSSSSSSDDDKKKQKKPSRKDRLLNRLKS